MNSQKTNTNYNKNLKLGVLWTVVDRFSVIIMQLIAMLLLARLLNPDSFAILGIALFFINISQVLIDAGMGGSLIKKDKVEDFELSTLFIYNISIAILMYLVIVLLSFYIDEFYNIEGVNEILPVIGISIIISSLGKIQNLMLYREMKFKLLSIISIISSFVALICAILLAYYDYGVWALVYQNVIYASMVLLLQFFYNRYIPKMTFNKTSFKEQWAFGGSLLFSKLINITYNNVFLLIFPKVVSLNFAGYYTQANKIQQIPISITNSIVKGVLFSVMTKIESKRELIIKIRRFSRHAYLIGFTVFMYLANNSHEILMLLLGEKWIGAAEILNILCFVGMGLFIAAIHKNTFKTIGKTKQIFRYEMVNSVIGLFVLLITFSFGGYAILYGVAISVYLSVLLFLKNVSNETQKRLKFYLYDIYISLLPVLISVFVFRLFKYFLIDGYNVIWLICSFPLFIFIIIGCGVVLKNKEIIYYLEFLKRKFYP